MDATANHVDPVADYGRRQVIPRRGQGSARCPPVSGWIVYLVRRGVTSVGTDTAHGMDFAGQDHGRERPARRRQGRSQTPAIRGGIVLIDRIDRAPASRVSPNDEELAAQADRAA